MLRSWRLVHSSSAQHICTQMALLMNMMAMSRWYWTGQLAMRAAMLQGWKHIHMLAAAITVCALIRPVAQVTSATALKATREIPTFLVDAKVRIACMYTYLDSWCIKYNEGLTTCLPLCFQYIIALAFFDKSRSQGTFAPMVLPTLMVKQGQRWVDLVKSNTIVESLNKAFYLIIYSTIEEFWVYFFKCADVNECEGNPCAGCINTLGSFSCPTIRSLNVGVLIAVGKHMLL